MNDLGSLCEESSAYRWIYKRGQLQGAREIMLHMGTFQFGPPDKETSDRIEAIADLAVLHEIGTRLLTDSSWSEALGLT